MQITDLKNLTHGCYVSKWMKQYRHSHSRTKICFLKYKLKIFANIYVFYAKFSFDQLKLIYLNPNAESIKVSQMLRN